MTAWFLVAGISGLALLGVFLWREVCEEIGRLISERRDALAENKFLKITDDELAEIILCDLRSGLRPVLD